MEQRLGHCVQILPFELGFEGRQYYFNSNKTIYHLLNPLMFQAFHIVLRDPQNSSILQLRKQRFRGKKQSPRAAQLTSPRAEIEPHQSNSRDFPCSAALTGQGGVVGGGGDGEVRHSRKGTLHN